jgi:glucose-1-phosphatase
MTKITTLIFDLGGVILNLDQERTFRAFMNLGARLEDINKESTIFNDFETGRIDADAFRQYFLTVFKGNISAQQIDDAWNAMLLDLPAGRLDMLRAFRKQFKLFLLSNTNSIHIDSFNGYLAKHHQGLDWLGLFDKVYYSYEIGHRKPDKSIYEYVLEDQRLTAGECIFIDDSKTNLAGAREAGLHTIWAKNPLDDEMVKEIGGLVDSFRISMN